MAGEREYIEGRRLDTTYVSEEFRSADARPMRYIYRVLPDGQRDGLVQIDNEVVLRTTTSGRQQIKVLVYADRGEMVTLTLQRLTAETGRPHTGVNFSLRGAEIDRLLEMAALARGSTFVGTERVRIDESTIEQYILTDSAIRGLLKRNLKLVAEIAKSSITDHDVIAIEYRRTALERFRRLLEDAEYFESVKARLQVTTERLWQRFFEDNTWIFGYGLFYVFTSGFDNLNLEQVVAGATVATRGKRADALLRTRGRISSLCFVELKTHVTDLLESAEYRADVWPPSHELAGAVAQVQRTVQSAEEHLRQRFQPLSKDGDPVGQPAYFYRPRAVVVAGNLAQFERDGRVNERRFSSFELFRRQLQSPEVITYDELYERARFITEAAEGRPEPSASL